MSKNPADEEAFVRLWDAFVANEDWRQAADLLKTRIVALTDARERVRLLIKLANLLDEKLGAVDEAVDFYHQVLTLDPDNRRALWALGVLYHDLEEWEKVIEIYLLRISLAESLEEKLSLRSQLASIYEQRLQQEDRALMEYIRAARLAPQNVRVLLNMEQLATKTESFRELLAVYEDVVERIERMELRVALYLKLARLYTQHLQDEQTATGYYKRALELSTGKADMLFSISNIYGEEEEWEELIATYTQLIRHADAPEVKSRLRREVARLYRHGLSDPTSAFYELVRVARYDPSEPGLVDELFELGVEADRHLELAAVMEDVGARLEPREARVALYTRLARLHLDDLQNSEQARAVIARALEIDPGHIPTQLVRFDLLQASREYEALAQALESFLSRPDLPEEVAKEQRRRLAQLCEEKLGDRERAVELYRLNMREPSQAEQGEGREEILEQLYRRQGTWEELIKLLAKRASSTEDPERLAEIAIEIAEINEKQLDQPDRSFFELIRAVRQTPTHERLLDELFRLGELTGSTAELEALCGDLLQTLADEQAAGVATRLALVLEADGAPDRAAEHYRRALDLDPTQPVAYQKLRARAENHFQWDQVVELDLARAACYDDPAEKVELLLSAAAILSERLADADKAVQLYERILSLAPASDEAAQALARLRAGSGPPPEPLDDGPTSPGTAEERQAALALTSREPAPPPPPIASLDELPGLDEPGIDEQDLITTQEQPLRAPAKTEPDDQDEVAEVFSAPRPPVAALAEIDAGDEEEQEDDQTTDVIHRQAKARTRIDPGDEREDEDDQTTDVIRRKASKRAEVTAADPDEAVGEVFWPPQPSVVPVDDEDVAEVVSLPRPPVEPAEPIEEPAEVISPPPTSAGADPFADREPTLVETNPGPLAEEQKEPTLVTASKQPARRTEPGSGEVFEAGPQHDTSGDDLQATTEISTAEPKPEPQPAPEREPAPNEDQAGPEQSVDDLELLEGDEIDEDFDDDFQEPLDEERTMPAAPIDPIQSLRQVVTADPQDPGGWERLAGLLSERDGPQAAFEALREGCAKIDDERARSVLYRKMSLLAQTPPLKLQLAELLEDQGRTDDAESSYRSVLRAEPARAEALDGLFRIYRQRQALDRYDAILSRSLNGVTEPTGRRSLLLRRAALRWTNLDRSNEALADLEQLLAADDGDLESLGLLEEILEASGRWDELVKAYQRHLPYCLTGEERVDLLTAIAILSEGQLGNPDEAIDHYRQALEEDPGHYSARDALINLLERRRDWLGAIEALAAAPTGLDDPELVSQLHYRRGKILEEQLLRPEEAEQAYRDAIAGQSPSREALEALRSLARRRGDWVEVIQFGKQLVLLVEDPTERSAQLTELARVWRDRLDNEPAALECFEQALEADPDNLEAAQVVAGRKLRDRQHEQAHQLLARLAKRGSDEGLSDAELAGVRLKLAQTAEALERPEEARAAFEGALELAATDHEVLTQYGYFLARQGDWQRAVSLYDELLRSHARDMQADELADLRCLSAQGYDKLGQPERAAAEYKLALEANPRHLPALRASIELARQLGRVREGVDLLRRMRELLPSPASRLKLSVQIGDALAGPLHDDDAAAKAYQEALEYEPNNIDLLEKLRRTLVHSGRFEPAVDALLRLAHLAEGDRARARYLRIAGDIQRERLDDDRKALELYLKAISAAPLDKRAHASAVKILTRMRDWPRLARLYEEQLHRLPPPIAGQEDHRISILTELVELYRYRLDDNRKAIQACEQLLAIDPNQIKVREDLARLYEMEAMSEQAIDAHRALIAESPFSIDSYHALRRIYEARGDNDRTLCLSATLAFLDEADQDERDLLSANRHALPIPPGRRLTETLYNQVMLHQGASGLLGEMLSFAADFARSLFVTSHKEYRLKPRDQLDLRRSNAKIAEVFSAALEFLSLPAPEIYGKGVMVKGIMAVNTSPVAVLYSEEAVSRASIPELRFMVARALAFTRPENLLAASLSAKQLRTLLEGIVELAYPGGPIHPVAQEVTGLARKLSRHIPVRKQERLLQLSSAYRDQVEELSIRDWLEGVEHTCNRAGLAFCGDLESAVQVLKAARVVSPSGSHRSLIRELIFYSISEQYFELRRALNASV